MIFACTDFWGEKRGINVYPECGAILLSASRWWFSSNSVDGRRHLHNLLWFVLCGWFLVICAPDSDLVYYCETQVASAEDGLMSWQFVLCMKALNHNISPVCAMCYGWLQPSIWYCASPCVVTKTATLQRPIIHRELVGQHSYWQDSGGRHSRMNLYQISHYSLNSPGIRNRSNFYCRLLVICDPLVMKLGW